MTVQTPSRKHAKILSSLRIELYPPLPPNASGFLDVGDGHSLYWEESGNAAGVPVVFLHGGPGGGTSSGHRRFFDPAYYRIILFDQRGAGRSKPYAETHANTTAHLVADMEKLRFHLKIDKWLVFGGSWGATLALAYGVRHPDNCLGFILRGVFLARAEELDWFITGIATVFPEAWRDFSTFVDEAHGPELLRAYLQRLNNPDPAVHGPAALAWATYENRCSVLIPSAPAPKNAAQGNGYGALAIARLEAHYFANAMFLAETPLLSQISQLHGHDAIIVQGRYDMICPPTTADALAQAWPKAELVMVADAGHAAMEPGIRKALVQAAERFKSRLT